MIIEKAWRTLRQLPPWEAYRLVHSTPQWLSKLQALVDGRPTYKAPVRFLGYTLENPVGLAAGLDKDARLTWTSWSVGFGFTVVGSVLPYPHPGASVKVLKRLPEGALVNRLGLPSEGARRVAWRLELSKPPFPVAVNIAGLEPSDYPRVARATCHVADWFEVNISCPNTREHSTFEDPWEARRILELTRESACGKPLLLKVPPTRDPDLIAEYATVVREAGADGVVASNTLKTRVDGVQAGLSGPPLYPTVRFMVERLRELLPENKVVVAVGGVDSPEKALELLEHASLVEVLTVLLYHGPGRVRGILEGVARALARR